MRLLLLATALAAPLANSLVTPLAQAQIPLDCHPLQRPLTRIAQSAWGLNAPISLFAAQIRQESACKPRARSHVGARGLAQFMPGTAHDMARWYPRQLAGFDPNNPQQAMTALVLYNRRLYRRIKGSADNCQRWAFTLHGYNAGPGWISRDRRLTRQRGANAAYWFDNTEHHSRRSRTNHRQTQHYVHQILDRYSPQFLAAGWGGTDVCYLRRHS